MYSVNVGGRCRFGCWFGTVKRSSGRTPSRASSSRATSTSSAVVEVGREAVIGPHDLQAPPAFLTDIAVAAT
jgi:hypothetical protein